MKKNTKLIIMLLSILIVTFSSAVFYIDLDETEHSIADANSNSLEANEEDLNLITTQNIDYSDYNSEGISFMYPTSWLIETDEINGGAYNFIASEGNSFIRYDHTILQGDYKEAALDRLTYFGSYPSDDFDLLLIKSDTNTNGVAYETYGINSNTNHQITVFLVDTSSQEKSYAFLEFENVSDSISNRIIDSLSNN